MDAESILRKAFPELCDERAGAETQPPATSYAPPGSLVPPGSYTMRPTSPTSPSVVPPPPLGPQSSAASILAAGHSLGGRFDVIASEIHKLESQCERERLISARWKEQAEQLGKKLRMVEQSEKQLLAQVSEFAQGENTASTELKTITDELAKTSTELDQYRKAWIAIRKREEAARLALQENAKLRTQLETLGHQARQLHGMCSEERARATSSTQHAASLEASLQQIHEKVQALETRNLHLSTEIKTLHEVCKSYEAEVTRISQATREREDALRLSAEKELLARFERELAETRRVAGEELERERASHEKQIREAKELDAQYARDLSSVRTEFERCAREEREKNERAVSSLVAESQTDQERSRLEIASLREARTRLERELADEHHSSASRNSENSRISSELKHERAKEREQLERAAGLEQRLSAVRTELSVFEARAEKAASDLQTEVRRSAALERECELMQTALLAQFRQTRETALRIGEEARALPEADAITQLASQLAAASEIATVQPSRHSGPVQSPATGKDRRANRPSQAKLDC